MIRCFDILTLQVLRKHIFKGKSMYFNVALSKKKMLLAIKYAELG